LAAAYSSSTFFPLFLNFSEGGLGRLPARRRMESVGHTSLHVAQAKQSGITLSFQGVGSGVPLELTSFFQNPLPFAEAMGDVGADHSLAINYPLLLEKLRFSSYKPQLFSVIQDGCFKFIHVPERGFCIGICYE